MLGHILPRLNSKKIILGSASPRRSQALKSIGLEFTVINSSFDENLDKSLFKKPVDYTVETATQKAKEIYTRLYSNANSNDVADLIVTADTIVVLEDKILEKPSSPTHAFEMLSSLSGRKHLVYTGMCLLLPKQKDPITQALPFIRSFSEETEVHFSSLTPEMINAYVQTGSPMDKAGGYGIQEGTGGSFIHQINGCYYNVTGFPLSRFCREVLKLIDENLLTL